MSKRQAAFQISKEGAFEDSDDDSVQTQPKRASAAVLSQRKIAVPRSRLGASGSGGSGSSNPFASLKTASPAPFSFKPAISSSSSSIPAAGAPSGAADDDTHEQLRVRALNEKFAATVAKHAQTTVYGDWRRICENYIKYYESVLAGKSLAQTPEPERSVEMRDTPDGDRSSGATSAVQQDTQQDTQPDEQAAVPAAPQITSTGFKFGGTSTASTFTFGDKKVDIGKGHASKPSTGGFVFQPGGTGQIRAENTASESTSASTGSGSGSGSSSESGSGSGSTESTGPTGSASGAFKLEAPSFSFGANSSTQGPAHQPPAVSFGANTSAADDAAASSKPTFSFGKNQDQDGKPKFSFGSSDKPSFTFGASKKAEQDKSDAPTDKKDEPKFSFGTQPSFTFGAKDDKPKFTFGSSEKPSFTFGTASTESTESTEQKNASEDKPKLAFGSSEKPVFSFGNTDKPSFTFGADKPADTKPAFTFGASTSGGSGTGPSATDKPAFTFGQPTQSTFKFGTGENPFGTPKTDAAWKPGQDVKIAGESGVDDETEAQADPQADLDIQGPGEENEDCLFEKRAKAFEQVDGQYQSLGLGLLRVLVHKETHKARVLLRAEGSGRVLLNVALRAEFAYPVLGKGQVRVLDVKAGEDKPTVYVAKVKTEADGSDLSAKLEEAKKPTA